LPDGNPICTATGSQQSTRLIADGAGGAIIVWGDTRSGDSDIYAQRVNAWGQAQWIADGVPVHAAASTQANPAIVPDAAGGAIIVWEHLANDGTTDIYAQRVNASGANLWISSGVFICSAQHGQYRPRAVSDGAGGAVIAWQDNRQGSFMVTDVYAQRVSASGTVQWTTDGVAICTAANAQTSVELVGDGSGGAIIAWLDGRGAPGSYVFYARRVDSAGAAQWTADGVALSTNTYDEEYNQPPAIATDGSGGAIVAWQVPKQGSVEADIFAQRITTSGSPQWAAGGVPVCAAVLPQWMPQIISDGAGGAIVAWLDERHNPIPPPPLLSDIYSQRVDESGVAQWTPDGVPLCTDAAGSFLPQMIADGVGGAVVSWSDSRNGSGYDVYASRINAAGVPLWIPHGVPVSQATSTQFAPRIVSDGFGGAIAVWTDYRSGSVPDVYANRVTGGGVIPTSAGDTPAARSLVVNAYPNPFSATTSIEVTSDNDGPVSVEVFDVAGRRVRELHVARAGTRTITFDGRDARGNFLASGVYFFRVTAGDATATRKIVIER
jgi:hypothetical protein